MYCLNELEGNANAAHEQLRQSEHGDVSRIFIHSCLFTPPLHPCIHCKPEKASIALGDACSDFTRTYMFINQQVSQAQTA